MNTKTTPYYLLKTRGHRDNEDYLQVRTEGMVLTANLRCKPPYNKLNSLFAEPGQADLLLSIIQKLEYGTLTKIQL